jgi:hypothetical protein
MAAKLSFQGHIIRATSAQMRSQVPDPSWIEISWNLNKPLQLKKKR